MQLCGHFRRPFDVVSRGANTDTKAEGRAVAREVFDANTQNPVDVTTQMTLTLKLPRGGGQRLRLNVESPIWTTKATSDRRGPDKPDPHRITRSRLVRLQLSDCPNYYVGVHHHEKENHYQQNHLLLGYIV